MSKARKKARTRRRVQGPTSSNIVWGAVAIGKEVGLKERQAFYALETGKLPARKFGRKWCADRRRLQQAIVDGAAAQ